MQIALATKSFRSCLGSCCSTTYSVASRLKRAKPTCVAPAVLRLATLACRMDTSALRARIIRAAESATWFGGIPGLTLDIDELADLGADNEFLTWWEFSRSLDAPFAPPRFHKNHPSLLAHAPWADKEWERLERLGKVEFFPPGDPQPPQLNVNPCALLLKERPGAEDDA